MQIQINKAQLPDKVKPLLKPSRYKCLYGGRGSAKSHSVAKMLLIRGANDKIRVLCGREYQANIKESVHRLLSDQIEMLGMQDHYTVLDTEIRGINGTLFSFAGFHQNSVTNLKSYEGYDYLWVEEAQVCSEKSWRTMLPTFRKPKSEIWITFNPDFDDDPTYQRFVVNPPKDCISIQMNYMDNPFWTPELEGERLYTLQNFPDDYENVWLGKPRTVIEGAVLGQEIQKAYEDKRVGTFDYDPSEPVYTSFDIGVNDSTCIWFGQRVGSRWRFIDYHESTDQSAPYYAKLLKDKPYIYGGYFTPHDSRAREFGTGMTPDEILAKHGIKTSEVPDMSIEDRVHAGKLFMAQCEFDAVKCAEGLKALKAWRWDVNKRTQMRRQLPFHNWASNGSDSFTYFALSSKLMHTFVPVYDFTNIETDFA